MSVKKRTLKIENSTLFFTNAEIALEVHACSVTSNSLQAHGLYLIRPFCPWIFQASIVEQVAFPTLGDLPDPGMEPNPLDLLHWQADSLPQRHMGSSALEVAPFKILRTFEDVSLSE